MSLSKIDQLRLINNRHEEKIIRVGLGVSYFPLVRVTKDGGKIYDSMSGDIMGVKWVYEDSEVLLFSRNLITHVYPSVDLLYVIVIYSALSGNFRAPRNAVVYDAKGGLHKVLTPPAFTSKLVIENLKINGHRNPPLSLEYDGALFFDSISWQTHNDKTVTVARIVYDKEWHETRVLYPETCDFGECVHSGRL